MINCCLVLYLFLVLNAPYRYQLGATATANNITWFSRCACTYTLSSRNQLYFHSHASLSPSWQLWNLSKYTIWVPRQAYVHCDPSASLCQDQTDTLADTTRAQSQVAPLPKDLPFRTVSKTIGSGAYASYVHLSPANARQQALD